MLNSLTSFRFIAALLVLLWHFGFRTIQYGYIGVTFFFVLSGFILTYNYHSKFNTLTKKQIGKFYVARFAKIYPVHLLTFLFAILLFLIQPPIDALMVKQLVKSAFFNIFLIHSYNPNPDIYFSFNGVSWSLSNEVLFYLSFPFLIFIILKLNKKATQIFTILCVVYGAYLLFVVGASFHRTVLIDNWLLYIFPVVRLFDFTIGICLGAVFLHQKDQIKNTGKNKVVFTVLEFVSVFLLIFSCAFSTHLYQQFKFSVYYIPFMCLLIYIFAFQKGFLSKILSAKPLIFLGEISFSFYMTHELVLRFVSLYITNAMEIYIITLTVTIVLSSIIYLCYEEPVRKYIRFGKKNKIKNKVAA